MAIHTVRHQHPGDGSFLVAGLADSIPALSVVWPLETAPAGDVDLEVLLVGRDAFSQFMLYSLKYPLYFNQ